MYNFFKKIIMKNFFLVSVFLLFFSCGSTSNDSPEKSINSIEVTDLGCKDGGKCLADHSCCASED
jgi:hypothetical protein